MAQEAYIKASNTNAEDNFGRALALSADGSILVVGAERESSSATGVDSYQNDNTATDSGAVYSFVRSAESWRQMAYIKASNTGASDMFGAALALSGTGEFLAVGAYSEDSGATGVNGDQANESEPGGGAVYVYVREGDSWRQQAYVKASNVGGSFGRNLALSGQGDWLAVAATTEDSAATGIDGDASDRSASSAGAVYVFARAGESWSQQAYVKASNTGAGDQFGRSLGLSADGAVLAVGAYGEDSATTGVDGDQADNSAPRSGAVYVFRRTGSTWRQEAYIKASNTDADDLFGERLALSANGSVLAVSGFQESSAATGVDGDQNDESAPRSGAVYIFADAGSGWRQEAYLKASNTDADDNFGGALALSGDGAVLAISAGRESGGDSGSMDADQADNSLSGSGAVYMFQRHPGGWSQTAYIKASNPGADDRFGHGVAMAEDGLSLAVGAFRESSRATGVDGDQADDSRIYSGAVYVFR